MSDNRPQDENTDDDSQDNQNQGGGQRRGKGLINYSLQPMKDAAIFAIHFQSPLVTDFLKTVGTYQAANGIRISLGHRFPEWKESLNTIYLDGTDGKQYGRLDTTRFPSGEMYYGKGRNLIRDNKIAMFHSAMSELIGTVKLAYGQSTEESFKPRAESIVLS